MHSRSQDFWRQFKKNKLAVFGLVLLGVMILLCILAPVLTSYGYADQALVDRFQLPSSNHLLGTDEFGRDILSRILYGGRLSFLIGLGSMVVSLLLGTFLGALAGFFEGPLDAFIMRIMDMLLAIPQLVLAIAIAAALGGGIGNVILAVSISSLPGYARIMRASVLSVKKQEYIEAAQTTGANLGRLLLVHILPNCLGPLIVQATLGVGVSILSAASLSFIGVGITPPTPEWGAMLSTGRAYIRDYPHLTLFPGLAIALSIFALNVLGDGIRDAFDPKQRRA